MDLVSSTGHDRFVKQDYVRLADFGIKTVREGIRWPQIEKEAGQLDYSTVLPILCASKEHDIEIIWDLLHFGWPDYLDIFAREWVDAFTRLAHGFADLLKQRGVETPLIAAINEISFVSWAAGDVAYLNPFGRCRGGELKRQLIRGAVAATKAVRSVIPGAVMVSPDPVIHIVGDPGIPGDVENAEAYRLAMFEAWDMLTGRLHPELGGKEAYIDIIGVNYYDNNQRWNFGRTLHRGDAEYRSFHLILKEVYERYGRPLFVAETGAEGEARPGWFAYIAREVGRARELGVPVEGICLYPIVNHPGWDDDRHCHNGLWDYADETGGREIYRPLAEEIHRYQESESRRGNIK